VHLDGKVLLLLFLQKKKALSSPYFIRVHDTFQAAAWRVRRQSAIPVALVTGARKSPNNGHLVRKPDEVPAMRDNPVHTLRAP